LPSSLTRVLSRALEYSSRPPESVCSTDSAGVNLYAAFLGSLESPSFWAEAQPHHLSATRGTVCLYRVLAPQPTGLNTEPCTVLGLSYSVPAYRTVHTSAGILTCFPSPTPFGLGLGSGLPMGGLSFPRKPWTYGEEVSHLLYRYSCLHKLLSRPIVVLTVYRVSA
jgi:hypothetical protein